MMRRFASRFGGDSPRRRVDCALGCWPIRYIPFRLFARWRVGSAGQTLDRLRSGIGFSGKVKQEPTQSQVIEGSKSDNE